MKAKLFFRNLGHFISIPFVGLSLLIGLSSSKKKYMNYESEPEENPEFERYGYVYKQCRKACFLANIKLTYEGLDKLPKVPCLFVANHKSGFDPVILLKIFSDSKLGINPVFVSKKEVLESKKIGNAAKLIDTIFLDRKNLRDAYLCIQKEKEVLKNKSVVVFLEGTRIKSDNFAPFKGAALEPAYSTMRSIVPVMIYGTKVIEPNNKKQIFKYKEIVVKFLEPIKYKEFLQVDKQIMAEKIRSLMYSEYEKVAKELNKEIIFEDIVSEYVESEASNSDQAEIVSNENKTNNDLDKGNYINKNTVESSSQNNKTVDKKDISTKKSSKNIASAKQKSNNSKTKTNKKTKTNVSKQNPKISKTTNKPSSNKKVTQQKTKINQTKK